MPLGPAIEAIARTHCIATAARELNTTPANLRARLEANTGDEDDQLLAALIADRDR